MSAKVTYIFSESEVSDIASELVKELVDIAPKDQAVVVTLSGDLGAGKTTLTQHIGKTLGIETHITSPTFVIMKRYETRHDIFDTLIHIDAYRLSSWVDLEMLDISKWIHRPGTLIIIEWPEKISDMNIRPSMKWSLDIVEDHRRELSVM